LPADFQRPHASLPDVASDAEARSVLAQLVVVKLNGGLGQYWKNLNFILFEFLNFLIF
jgi:hypothetical protein